MGIVESRSETCLYIFFTQPVTFGRWKPSLYCQYGRDDSKRVQ